MDDDHTDCQMTKQLKKTLNGILNQHTAVRPEETAQLSSITGRPCLMPSRINIHGITGDYRGS